MYKYLYILLFVKMLNEKYQKNMNEIQCYLFKIKKHYMQTVVYKMFRDMFQKYKEMHG